MSKSEASMLKEDMEWMGPVRTKDVTEAQSSLVQTVFHLSDKGDIVISTKEDIIDFDL